MLITFKYAGGSDPEPFVLPLAIQGDTMEGFNLNYLPEQDKLMTIFGTRGILTRFNEMVIDLETRKYTTDELNYIMRELGDKLIKEFPALHGTYRKYINSNCSSVLKINVF